MDTKHCADFPVTHPTLEHSDNVSAKLLFVGIAEITFGRLWHENVEVVDMPS